ncbi:MAG: hypothetical protein A2W91_19045 [Bacteroidetes bacterium GWF2_38_335]|nr:MAG: hypothetical protein A2W91_19045 [Bacteroidetes bacterium GWF2_38_335]OFY80232.1 MAG: hypothetical protein A2281_17150 [Bacteroidetes bacterium RIFOXYA12_FULL_38_20]HBS88741.1 hypothetical protein [Bacteroidales bacterium]
MDINISPGCVKQSAFIVGNSHTASFLGSGTLEVLATPALIAFLENTAMECVQNSLPKGFTTVGTYIEMNHLKATALGKEVNTEAVLQSFEGKRLVFGIVAYCGDDLIASGIHHRFIVNIQPFLDKL